jgi:Protein of unknown function (DUF3379)
MIDHQRYRETLMADPHTKDSEMRAHREACAECNAYTEKLLHFESRLERALKIELPAAADANLLPFARKSGGVQPRRARRWLALAASMLLAAVVAGGIWLTLPQESLAADVVAHMAGEPDAWQRTDVAVPNRDLNAVLDESKLRLKPDAGVVSYASSCDFRGHRVPHLVVQSPTGPVTVMVLVHEKVRKAVQFDEQGYRGTIVPVPGHGSIAVLMREPGVDRAQVDRVAARVDDAIVWTR